MRRQTSATADEAARVAPASRLLVAHAHMAGGFQVHHVAGLTPADRLTWRIYGPDGVTRNLQAETYVLAMTDLQIETAFGLLQPKAISTRDLMGRLTDAEYVAIETIVGRREMARLLADPITDLHNPELVTMFSTIGPARRLSCVIE